MKNFIKTLIVFIICLVVFIICYFFITLIEIAIFKELGFTPIDTLIVIIIIFNLAFAGFLTDYLI